MSVNHLFTFSKQQMILGVPEVAQWKQIWAASMRTQVQSLSSLNELRIWHCHELWYKVAEAARIWCCCGCGVGQQLQLWLDPWPGNPPYAEGAVLKKKKKDKIILAISLPHSSILLLQPGLVQTHDYFPVFHWHFLVLEFVSCLLCLLLFCFFLVLINNTPNNFLLGEKKWELNFF